PGVVSVLCRTRPPLSSGHPPELRVGLLSVSCAIAGSANVTKPAIGCGTVFKAKEKSRAGTGWTAAERACAHLVGRRRNGTARPGVDSKTRTDKDDGSHTKDLQKVKQFVSLAKSC